jgi:hypothetical protein
MEPGAIAFWALASVVLATLFVWWWRGVHAKSKVDQAADILRVRGARSARNQEKRLSGGVSLADVGEFRQGITDPDPTPVILAPDDAGSGEPKPG